ncbi:MAG: flagellar export chaperone FliS [Rhodocyclaceae bacterium]|nr:flagellar export chaperone FliS [Rhodocyclaceae bacterium]
MYSSTTNPSQAYSQVGVETGIMGASPHSLILMLFDGALAAVARAQHGLATGAIAEKGTAITKAIDILTNGLKASLDYEKGGELAARLAALYDYMCDRLFYANLKNDQAALGEVQQLLSEIRDAWAKIANDPAVVSASQEHA